MQTLTTSLEQSVEQHQTFSPLLMQANHILSLSQHELEAAISEAIDENPALELEDCAVCPSCGRRTQGAPCTICAPHTREQVEKPQVVESGDRTEDDPWSRFDAPPQQTRSSSADPEFDPMSIIANAADLRDQILASAMASLDSDEERALAMIIVDAIDDRGFLTLGLEDIARQVDVEIVVAERVLQLIQEIAPAGTAARSLRECLLLQIDYLRQESADVPDLASRIVQNHLEELGAKRLPKIARALGADLEAVERACDFIRDQLTPHPLQFQQSVTWTSPSSGGHVVPDVVVTIESGKLSIEVPNAIYDRLHPEAFYQSIARAQSAAPTNGAEAPSPDGEAVSHARLQVARAQQFIWAVRQRRQTLLRVAEYVCEYQEAYIRGNARGLRPLTRSEVANALGVHESTCSRAVASKFIMLPSRKVIPMSDLFAASLSVKHVIQQIIDEEAAQGGALSDAQISERLLDYGIRIARRTVAKYRGQMHILPSTIR